MTSNETYRKMQKACEVMLDIMDNMQPGEMGYADNELGQKSFEKMYEDLMDIAMTMEIQIQGEAFYN